MRKKRGDCYEVHGEAIFLNNEDGLLCHGMVYHPTPGWHGHAWIERGEIVRDMSNGTDKEYPKGLYYALGHVKDVKRYTKDEAREEILRAGTWGPWDDSISEDDSTSEGENRFLRKMRSLRGPWR